ncbi:MAG: hypothetical protein JWN03_9034 [Nocardia sp.]|nr:hypothetical protein [Nocardia sp.]MCU1648759.1 hypothetical protein [Nocardia sp.]
MQNFATNLGTIGYDVLSIGQGMVSLFGDVVGMGGTGAGQYPLS